MINGWSIEEIRKLKEIIAQKKQQVVQFVTGVEAEYIVFDGMERKNDAYLAAIDSNGNKVVLHAYKSTMMNDTLAQVLDALQNGGLVKIKAKVLGTRIVTIISAEPYNGPVQWDGIGVLSLRGQRIWLTKSDGNDVLITDKSIKGALVQQQGDGTVIRFIGIERDSPSGIRVMQYIHYETPPPELLMQLAEEVISEIESEETGSGQEQTQQEREGSVIEGEVVEEWQGGSQSS